MRASFLPWVVATLIGCAGVARSPRAPGLMGQAAPDFAAERPDGTPLWLSSLRGRVLVLDLWASWCRGCEEKLPLLDAMAGRLKGVGIETLAVSLDADRQPFTRIVGTRSWQMTALFDTTGKLGDLYQPGELPSIFLIDSQGVVRHSIQGYTGADLPGIEARARALAGTAVRDGER